jgi:hypothetical protein
VKKLILVIVPVVMLPVLVMLDTSHADSDIPDKEIAASQTEESDSSASAAITITMYTGDGE